MSLRKVDPKGRLDVALFKGAEQLADHVGGGVKKAWNWGLGDVVERMIENAGLSKPVTLVGIAEDLGLIRKRRQRALR